MKILRHAVLFLIVVASLSMTQPLFAIDNQTVDPGGINTPGAGACLNQYNNCLIGCDQELGGWANVGCKADCWVNYYACIANSALNSTRCCECTVFSS
jgi:hypothetical protein